MGWHGILGHDNVVEQFRRALGRDRLATSFLFVGPEGIGKRTFALKFAQALLCEQRPEAAMDPCEQCPSCTQVVAGSHPDVQVVAKPAERAFIPLELFIGDKEHRMRQGLCHNIGMKPFMGGRKVAIIDDADYLNAEGANCLLKTLEEPPPRSVLILVGTSPAKQLPTIRSRCQLIRFAALSEDEVAELLVRCNLVADPEEARRLAAHSEGSVGRAVELADSELWAFRDQFHQRLIGPVLDSVRLAADLSAFVDQAGKEAPARRARLRQVVAFAADFYQQLLRVRSGDQVTHAGQDRALLGEARRNWPGDALIAADCLDRCLDAAEQIDRNANQATLIEAWLDDLARLTWPVIPRTGA